MLTQEACDSGNVVGAPGMPWPLSVLTLVNDESPSARANSIDAISCKMEAIQTVKRQHSSRVKVKCTSALNVYCAMNPEA